MACGLLASSGLAACRGGTDGAAAVDGAVGDPGTSASAAAAAGDAGSAGANGPASTVATSSTVAPATLASSELVAAELPGRPTDSSVTISVIPAAAMELFYEYGSEPGRYTARTAPQQAAAGRPAETTLTGLQPGTRYYYRLRVGDRAGAERTFTTQRRTGQSFTFAVQGDSHPERVGKQFDAALYARTLASAASAGPDFYVCMGDDFSVDTLKSVTAETVRSVYLRQRQWLTAVDAPLFLVNGNHEQASMANLDGTADNVAVWAQNWRNSYFPQPAPDGFYGGNAEPVPNIGLLRNYFSYTWGDALFVVIDPYWHTPSTVDNEFGADKDTGKKRDQWAITLGATQYRWLEQTLRASKATHKFVFAHHVNGTGRGGVELANTFEWGDLEQFPAYRPGWSEPIHQLMASTGVSIFFQGHDHLFARQELDGVVYQTMPEPANPFETIENEAAYRSGVKLPNSGHVRVDVTPAEVTVTYIRSHLDRPDEIAYTYTVR